MRLKVINTEPLPGNEIAPPLKMDEEKELVGTCTDSKGNVHYDVGIKSTVNWITSYETGEILPDSEVGKVWWCHPSRFKEINQ